MSSSDDYIWFVNRTLDQMAEVLRQLGDEHACERPEIPGASTPFGIVTHCLGVMNSWAAHLVAGREIVRDREAEFRGGGDIETLIETINAARVQFRSDIDAAHFEVSAPDAYFPYGKRQGASLFHVFELVQHLGQLGINRALLPAAA